MKKRKKRSPLDMAVGAATLVAATDNNGERMPDGDISENMLLWTDLETSGSDVAKDCIIEVGCILTTHDLEEISTFQALVHPSERGLGRLMMNSVVREMHQKNGLLDEVVKLGKDAPRVDEVSRAILKWLEANKAPQGKTVLCGSGVGHFDRHFIQKYMPQLYSYLRYWVIDTGVIRRAHQMWTGEDLRSEDDEKAHRAMDDIRHHLDEARMFKALWKH
jgi:oligoribonuclease